MNFEFCSYVIHERGGYYRVSLKLYELANQTAPRSSLIAIAKPYIDELSSSLGESVHLVVRDENDVVYVYKVTQPIGSIQMASKIGMRLPMYRCATGKAIMASLPNGEIKKIFESSNVISVTKNTITDFSVLMKEINQVRINNYAMDNEENEEFISCIATSLGKEGDDISYVSSHVRPEISDGLRRRCFYAPTSARTFYAPNDKALLRNL